MKPTQFILSILFLSIIFNSCEKECNKNQNVNDLWKGKIKTLSTTYSFTDIMNYYFYYDSINGELTKVTGGTALQNENIEVYKKYKIDDSTLLVYYKYVPSGNPSYQKYIIKLNNKQIISITGVDTLSSFHDIVTRFVYNNNKIESIFDKGDFISSNIHYMDFAFDSVNCLEYNSEWHDNFLGNGDQQLNVKLTYTNLLNTNLLSGQLPCTILSDPDNTNLFFQLIYFLGIDGYYAIKPNKYLLDSANYSGQRSYIKFDYLFIDNQIVSVTKQHQNGILIDKMTYY